MDPSIISSRLRRTRQSLRSPATQRAEGCWLYKIIVLQFQGNPLKVNTLKGNSCLKSTPFLQFYFLFFPYIFATRRLELLCSISSFASFEERGANVVCLHFAWFYFSILTADIKVQRIPNSDRFLSVLSHHMINFDFHKTGDGTKNKVYLINLSM